MTRLKYGGLALVVLGLVVVVIGIVMLVGDGDDSAASPPSSGIAVTTAPPSDAPVASSDASSTTTRASTTTTSTTTAATTTTTTTTTTTITPETPEEFLVVLDEALRGDVDVLVSRLNQATIDIYGEDQCRQNLPGLLDPESSLVIREIGEPTPWEYVIDGVTTDVGEALPVEIDRRVAGQTVPQEVHWQLVDGRWTWFTDCGEPLAG